MLLLENGQRSDDLSAQSGDHGVTINPFVGGLRYSRNALQVGGDLVAAATQDRVFGVETPTDGYTTLKLFGVYSIQRGGLMHTITVRLENATNET